MVHDWDTAHHYPHHVCKARLCETSCPNIRNTVKVGPNSGDTLRFILDPDKKLPPHVQHHQGTPRYPSGRGEVVQTSDDDYKPPVVLYRKATNAVAPPSSRHSSDGTWPGGDLSTTRPLIPWAPLIQGYYVYSRLILRVSPPLRALCSPA